MYEEDEDVKPGRPLAVTLLWVCCAFMIFAGVLAVGFGILMFATPELFDGGDDEVNAVFGGIIAAIGLAIGIFHIVPLVLKRQPSSWKFINTFLIVDLIVLAVTTTFLIIFPLPVLALWSRDDVKRYYGILRSG